MSVHDFKDIQSVFQGAGREEKRQMVRGEIYYVEGNNDVVGSEQQGDRPAIIVSNNTGNSYSRIKEVVFLTTKQKRVLPTHVTINSSVEYSTAICEQITTVSDKRIKQYIGKCTDAEMRDIDTAIMVSLAINTFIQRQQQKVTEIQEQANKPMFEAAADAVLQQARDHIDKIIDVANRIVKLNESITGVSSMEIPNVTGTVSIETEEMIHKFILEKMESERQKYYDEINRLIGNTKEGQKDAEVYAGVKQVQSVNDKEIIKKYVDEKKPYSVVAKELGIDSVQVEEVIKSHGLERKRGRKKTDDVAESNNPR